MKNKGFTLIELIAIVVMLGVILLIVFPATSRLMRDNEKQEYSNYYEMVTKAATLYSRTRKDDVGGFGANGCVDDTTIADLVKQDYIQKYLNKDGIECKSPGDFTAAELSSANINPDDYVNIKIENKEGVISTSVSMICKKATSNKIYYQKLIEKSGNCDRYIAETSNSLYKAIADSSSPNYISSIAANGSTTYISSANNNYVWYSGKMWKIISYDTNEKTIKIVTDNVQSIISYDNGTNNYRTSNLYTWLNNTFLGTLYNSSKYLADASWDYTSSALMVMPISGNEFLTSKVGTISAIDYFVVKSNISNGSAYWTLTPSRVDSDAGCISSSNQITTCAKNTFTGVRPAVVLRSNVPIISGGDGTLNNPYKLVGDTAGNIGAPLNSRIVGEYVQYNGTTFRISSKTSRYTRLVATTTLNISDIKFHATTTLYSDDTVIANYLNNTWGTSINDRLVLDDFCRNQVSSSTPQLATCNQSDIITLKIGIPRIGDMYTVASNKEYWTINSSDQLNKVNVVTPAGGISTKLITDTSGVLPVINVNSNATITGGNGTPSNPYTIQ